MGANRELRNEYRVTWNAFSRQLDELQRLVEAGERDRVKSALLEVEKARLAHNDARDRLAAHLTREIEAADTIPEEIRVRKTAQLLWEFSGRPQGTAEKDWFSAERLVRSAAAGVAMKR